MAISIETPCSDATTRQTQHAALLAQTATGIDRVAYGLLGLGLALSQGEEREA